MLQVLHIIFKWTFKVAAEFFKYSFFTLVEWNLITERS